MTEDQAAASKPSPESQPTPREREPEEWLPVGNEPLFECPTCGAAVPINSAAKHWGWHA